MIIIFTLCLNHYVAAELFSAFSLLVRSHFLNLLSIMFGFNMTLNIFSFSQQPTGFLSELWISSLEK